MRVTGIFRYPVKGFRGTALESATVEPCGLAGDRRWMVVNAQGRFLTQRQLPAMARFDAMLSDGYLTLRIGDDHFEVPRLPPAVGAQGGRISVVVWRSQLEAATVDPAADRWLSSHLGQPCRLVHLDDPQARPVEASHGRPGEHVSFADAFPVLLTNTGSLAVLNEALDRRIGMDRFRANLVVEGAPAWAEDDWRLLRIGSLVFRAAKSCVRCVVTSIDQRSGEITRPGEPLRALGRMHRRQDGIVFGNNLVPQGHGMVALGDRVEILDQATFPQEKS